MKRTGKIFLIVAACLVVFGLLLSAGVAIAVRTTGAGSHRMGFHSHYGNEVTRTAEMDSINSLSLALVNEPVYIVRGGSSVSITWIEMYDGQYELTQREGEFLSLSRATSRNWGFWGRDWTFLGFGGGRFGWSIENASNRPVTVTIPQHIELHSIDLAGADIRVVIDYIDALEIGISGANVTATLQCVTARDIEVSGANAIVTLSDVEANDIEVSGANAEVVMNIPSTDGWSFDVSGVHAALRVDGQRWQGFAGSRSVSVNGVNAVLNVHTR